MGKTKLEDEKFLAINCTISQEDLKLAKEMGETDRISSTGEPVYNISLGIRRVFFASRQLANILIMLEEIRKLKGLPATARKMLDKILGPMSANTDS